MEIDNLKGTWSSLDERLKKQEVLNENIIKEILKSKSGKALNQVVNYTYFGIVISFLIFIPLVYRLATTDFGLFKTSIFGGALLFLLLMAITGISNVVLLHKIDLLHDVSHNISLVQRYKIRIKKQLFASYAFGVIFICFAVIACIMSPDMELWRWIVIGVFVIVGAVGAYWEYKRMYNNNLDTILKSLDELKALNEYED